MKKIYWLFVCVSFALYSLTAHAEGLTVFTDIMYWQASQASSSTWATTGAEPAPGLETVDVNDMDFNPDFGYRIGLMYEPSTSFFDTKIYYTSFTTQSSEQVPVGGHVVYPQYFSGFLSRNFFFGADSSWKIDLNEVDIEASHLFPIGNSFTFRPSIGIKGATIDQTVKTKWLAELYTANEKVINDFTGIGPSLGLDTNWKIYKGLSFEGDFSLALMYGNWDDKDVYQRPAAALGLVTPTTITTKTTNSELGTAMYDYFLGFKWEYHGKSQISMKLGYEMEHWSDQYRATDFEQLPVHGDLTLQGATCGIYIEV